MLNPGLYKQVPYDAVKDFAPIAELVTSPNVFIATPASGITSIAELVARAKEKPDTLNYASAGIGTTPHLTGEWLKSVAGISMTHVPFAGAGPALQAILAGTVQLACASLPGAHPLILNHDVRALAVTGSERWYDLPEVPTMIELGYKDFLSDTFHGMLGAGRNAAGYCRASCHGTAGNPAPAGVPRATAFARLRGDRQRPGWPAQADRDRTAALSRPRRQGGD